MDSILSIARYTFLQQFRNRLYLVVIFFGFMIIVASLLFGVLAGDQELRIILNLGLAATEFFGVLAALFGAVTLVLEEMESRTIYLILTRSLPRGFYILGRFLGLVSAIVLSMILMGIVHWGILFLKGMHFDPFIILVFGFMILKVMIITALAIFFSLFSSSTIASVVFTFFFWLMGHFVVEMEFMARKAGSLLVYYIVKFFSFIVPNLQFLNYRELIGFPGLVTSQAGWGLFYAVLYSSACLALSMGIFSKKEF